MNPDWMKILRPSLLSLPTLLLTSSAFGFFWPKSEDELKVSNYVGSVVCPASQLIVANSVSDIQDAVKRAAESGLSLKVRSIQASRSYSPVICPESDGIVLNVEPLKRLLSVDASNLRVTVQPGIRVGDLQEQLHAYGLAFPVTPDYNGVSVAGGMGAGAHNSSLQFPTAIGDWVEEIKLVDGTGALRVLQGEALDAARVNLGLLGVIYEVTLRVLPQFKLQHNAEKLSDANIENEALALARQHTYAKLNWFPLQKTYILDTLDQVPLSTPGDSFSNSWTTPAIAGLIKKFPQPIELLNSNRLVQCSVEALRVKTWISTYKVVDSSFKNPVGLSYNMIGGSCPDGQCSWDRGIKTRTVEVAFAAKDFPAWAQDIKELIRLRPACFPILGIYLRFSAPSKAYLGQAYGQETVMFEIHIPQSNEKQLEASSDVYDEIVQLTLGKYNGRPHWGKNSQPYFEGLGPAQFPKWNAFVEQQKALDPQGVFENPFWKKITTPALRFSAERPSECGVTRECLCALDSDCGSNARCESGILFTDARICVKK